MHMAIWNGVMVRVMVETGWASNMCTRMIYGSRSILLMTRNRMILLEIQDQMFFGINFQQ
jgi:hypothetical protein